MWPFSSKQQPIWEQIDKKFLRQKTDVPLYAWDTMDIFNVYAITYKDVLTGKTRIEESHELVW